MRLFNRRFAIWLAKGAILALVIWGGHRTIAAGLDELNRQQWRLSQLHIGWAIVAGLLYLVSQIPSGWFWHGVLGALGQHVGWLRTLRAYFIGHLGKYVPGKAMVVVLRAALVGQPHVKTSLAVVAVFYETFTTMAVGAVLAAVVLIFSHHEQVWLIAGSLALAAIVGLPTIPPIFIRILRLMKKAPPAAEMPITSNAAVQQAETHPIHFRPALFLGGWCGIAIGWMLAGASLWATVRAIGVSDLDFAANLPLYTATTALAVVLGFVSMLPAGVGVREIALLQLLAPHLEALAPNQGQMYAMVAVVVVRLIWLAAELAIAGVLFPLGRTLKDEHAAVKSAER